MTPVSGFFVLLCFLSFVVAGSYCPLFFYILCQSTSRYSSPLPLCLPQTLKPPLLDALWFPTLLALYTPQFLSRGVQTQTQTQTQTLPLHPSSHPLQYFGAIISSLSTVCDVIGVIGIFPIRIIVPYCTALVQGGPPIMSEPRVHTMGGRPPCLYRNISVLIT